LTSIATVFFIFSCSLALFLLHTIQLIFVAVCAFVAYPIIFILTMHVVVAVVVLIGVV